MFIYSTVKRVKNYKTSRKYGYTRRLIMASYGASSVKETKESKVDLTIWKEGGS
jgi:hypothetical protein